MTRASYAGGQRYAVTWTGDNNATWNHLKLAVHQMINLGLSGFSYGAADVGGFTGGPSPELLTRWFEIATFTPIFRDHSSKGTPRAEPWVDGPEQLAIRRRFVDERYRLMPYLYALADQNARTGDPLMRPVFYDYPDAIGASCDQSMTFTLGRDLLVTPPPHMESPQSYDVCLPAGGWFNYWTGQKITAAKISETPKLDTLPVFVRAGAILPRASLVQSTTETPVGPLELNVYPGEDCRGVLYADDGHTMAYTKDGYARQMVRCTATAEGVAVNFDKREGAYSPWWKAIRVVVHDWQGAAHATLGGHALAATVDAEAQTASLTIPDQPRAISLALSH
jgi:alpha-glucosidase